jgi:hypothetical protein
MKKYFDRKTYGKVFLDMAQSRIDEYRTQIEDMKSNSHTAQKAVRINYFPGLLLIANFADSVRWKLSLISSKNRQTWTRLRWRGGRLR